MAASDWSGGTTGTGGMTGVMSQGGGYGSLFSPYVNPTSMASPWDKVRNYPNPNLLSSGQQGLAGYGGPYQLNPYGVAPYGTPQAQTSSPPGSATTTPSTGNASGVPPTTGQPNQAPAPFATGPMYRPTGPTPVAPLPSSRPAPAPQSYRVPQPFQSSFQDQHSLNSMYVEYLRNTGADYQIRQRFTDETGEGAQAGDRNKADPSQGFFNPNYVQYLATNNHDQDIRQSFTDKFQLGATSSDPRNQVNPGYFTGNYIDYLLQNSPDSALRQAFTDATNMGAIKGDERNSAAVKAYGEGLNPLYLNWLQHTAQDQNIRDAFTNSTGQFAIAGDPRIAQFGAQTAAPDDTAYLSGRPNPTQPVLGADYNSPWSQYSALRQTFLDNEAKQPKPAKLRDAQVGDEISGVGKITGATPDGQFVVTKTDGTTTNYSQTYMPKVQDLNSPEEPKPSGPQAGSVVDETGANNPNGKFLVIRQNGSGFDSALVVPQGVQASLMPYLKQAGIPDGLVTAYDPNAIQVSAAATPDQRKAIAEALTRYDPSTPASSVPASFNDTVTGSTAYNPRSLSALISTMLSGSVPRLSSTDAATQAYRGILGRSPNPDEASALAKQLSAAPGLTGYATAVRNLVNQRVSPNLSSTPGQATEEQVINDLYQGIYGRDATATEVGQHLQRLIAQGYFRG